MKFTVYVGFKVTNIQSCLGEEVGEFDKLSMIMKDMTCTTEKLNMIEVEDANSFINNFQSKQIQDILIVKCILERW